ncbi:MAG: ABC transporter ATP-binding protein [Spiroplasma sp.]|nr:ABC transporter ATP-binding protein [Mycoplasmatales bacterium]
MEELFKAKNLVKSYKNGLEFIYALNHVDVTFEAEKINTILGPSGSGKTTLLNVLSGLDYVEEGQILFEGNDIAKNNDKKMTEYRRNNIGFIFQSYNLISTLTVRENVELGAYLSKKPLVIDEVLDQVGLMDLKDRYPHQLSGGQQQRVAIARVLVKNPKVIFCDEPTGALDEVSGRNVLDLLQKLNEKYKTTLIMVTHNPNIANMSHKVITFNSGKIVETKENKKVMSAFDIEWS